MIDHPNLPIFIGLRVRVRIFEVSPTIKRLTFSDYLSLIQAVEAISGAVYLTV
jgi:hypothetical protein